MQSNILVDLCLNHAYLTVNDFYFIGKYFLFHILVLEPSYLGNWIVAGSAYKGILKNAVCTI